MPRKKRAAAVAATAAVAAMRWPYLDEVVGTHVAVEIGLSHGGAEFFPGVIKGIKKIRGDEGTAWREVEHFIQFDDGDELWFDLRQEEANGRLRWDCEEREIMADEEVELVDIADEYVAEEVDTDATDESEWVDVKEEDEDRKPAAVTSSSTARTPAAPVPDWSPSSAFDAAPDEAPSSSPAVSRLPDTAISSAPVVARKPSADTVPSTVPSTALLAAGTAGHTIEPAMVVTPEKKAQQQPKRSKRTAASVKHIAKQKKISPISGKRAPKHSSKPGKNEANRKTIMPDYINSDLICLNDFDYWLRNIHRGAHGNVLSKANGNSVMRQVTKLVKGVGVTNTGKNQWPSGIYFYRGTKFDLNTNFDHMHGEAKEYEAMYGKDLGNGWLLQHPIKKLDLYRPYARDIRAKKRRFLCFMISVMRNDSPTAVLRDVSDVLRNIFAFTVREKVYVNDNTPRTKAAWEEE